MTVIYAASVKNISVSEELLKKVSARRRDFISRVQNGSAKKLCLAAGLLLAKFVGTDEYTDGKGKPFVKGGVEFSISHSNETVVLALSEYPVGADVEFMGRTDILKIARRSMTDNEYERIISSAEPVKEFYRLWTMKESYVKMLGIGFDKMPDRTDVLSVSGTDFYSTEFDGYMLSVCSRDFIEEKISFFEAGELI